MNSFDIRIPYIEVRNKDREIIGIIEGAEIFFEYAFHGCGEFEIYCRATQNNLDLLKKDNYITFPENADTKAYLIEPNSNIWIIEKIERNNSRTGGRWITVTGREAKQIVDRRIIRDTTVLNANKSLVQQVKDKLFNSNIINPSEGSRKISGFVFNNNVEKNEETGEYLDSIMKINVNDETQVTYDNLFDYTENFYLNYRVGAKLRFNRDTKELLYTIYKGTDKSNILVFSRGNENLLSTNYIEDWSLYKTSALVGGEEKEFLETDPETGITLNTYTKRTILVMGDNSTDIDRRETFVDARDLSSTYEAGGITKKYTSSQYNAMLKERGLEKLSTENNKQIEFTGEIDVTNDRHVFNRDYYLGDIVKIRDDDFGIEVLVRISKLTKVQNNEGYREYFEYEIYEYVDEGDDENESEDYVANYFLTVNRLGEKAEIEGRLQYNLDDIEEDGFYWRYMDKAIKYLDAKSIQFRIFGESEGENDYEFVIASNLGTQFDTEILSSHEDESSRIKLTDNTVINITARLKET